MLADIFRHWRYFVPQFAGYGIVLGALFGGLTYPILGAIIGAPYGLAGGILVGLLMGIGVPVYNRYFAAEDADTYQGQLTFGAAAVITAITALPLLFIYSLVAGLVTAYITHQYTENPIHSGEKRKHTVDAYQRRDRVFTHAATSMMRYANILIGIAVTVAMGGYLIYTAVDPFAVFRLIELIFIGVGGVIYGFVVACFIAAINGLFIVMVNRLFFDPDMQKSRYKARIVPMVGVLTLFLSMIVTGGIGAPFAAIVGAMGANRYADWYYEFDDDKAKRDNHSRLAEEKEDVSETPLDFIEATHSEYHQSS